MSQPCSIFKTFDPNNPWTFFDKNDVQHLLHQLVSPMPRQTCQFLSDTKKSYFFFISMILAAICLGLVYLYFSPAFYMYQHSILYTTICLCVLVVLCNLKHQAVYKRLVQYYNHTYCLCIHGKNKGPCHMYPNPYLGGYKLL